MSAVTGFGAWLRRRRHGEGWTQEELAERAGMDQGTISAIEVGRSRPTMDTVRRLALAFTLPVEDVAREAGYLDADDDAPDDATAELLAEIERQLNQIPGLRAQLAQRKAERPKDYPGLLRSTAKHLGILAGSLLGEDDLGRES